MYIYVCIHIYIKYIYTHSTSLYVSLSAVYTCLSGVLTLLLLAFGAFYWLWSQSSWSDAPPPGSASLICASDRA